MIIPKILKDFFSYKNDSPIDETWEQESKAAAKAPRGVSEPVISFVNTFKKNPRRFETVADYFGMYSVGFIFRDKIKNIKFYCYKWKEGKNYSDWTFTGVPFKLTRQEKEYLVDNVVRYYIDREKKYKATVEMIARKRLYEVYK